MTTPTRRSGEQFEVVVEVPKGSRNKYEMNHQTGVIHLDRQLFTATRYPADYGFIDHTLGEDGDPLDALVLVNDPTFPGCHITCRPVGVFLMTDENGRDSKVLAVPSWDTRVNWQEIDDVPESLRLEIAHFFEIYKELEPGKASVVEGWEGRESAVIEIVNAYRRCDESNPIRP